MPVKPQTIPDYIAAKPEAARSQLQAIYACLKKTAPKAEEGIKWGMPTFTGTRILFSFAAFKNHVSLFPTPSVIEVFKKELEGYTTTKAAIHFSLDKPVPKTLVTKIARYRVKDLRENDTRWA